MTTFTQHSGEDPRAPRGDGHRPTRPGLFARAAAQICEPVAGQLSLLERELERLLPCGDGLVGDVCYHLLSAKGKRLRPVLLLLAADMAGGSSDDECITAAAAVELIHTATLIHDDTIDGSPTRRGQPTINRAWDDRVSILMGDFIYSRAFEVLSESRMYGAMTVLAASTNDMTVAEMAQIERKNDLETTERDYMSIIGGKTASLIAAACELGAMVAGGHDGVADKCRAFGRQIGLAYQMTDDVMDFIADADALGKPVGTDITEGVVTLPLISALRKAKAPDRSAMIDLASSLIATRGTDREHGGEEYHRKLLELVRSIEAHGGFDYVRRQAERCIESAKDTLSGFRDCPSRDALRLAADFILQRSFNSPRP